MTHNFGQYVVSRMNSVSMVTISNRAIRLQAAARSAVFVMMDMPIVIARDEGLVASQKDTSQMIFFAS